MCPRVERRSTLEAVVRLRCVFDPSRGCSVRRAPCRGRAILGGRAERRAMARALNPTPGGGRFRWSVDAAKVARLSRDVSRRVALEDAHAWHPRAGLCHGLQLRAVPNYGCLEYHLLDGHAVGAWVLRARGLAAERDGCGRCAGEGRPGGCGARHQRGAQRADHILQVQSTRTNREKQTVRSTSHDATKN